MFICQVLDPRSNDTILTEDDIDSDGANGLKDDEMEGESDVDSSTDSEVEDIDDTVEETAVERTRQAVRDALGMAGSVTDTVSARQGMNTSTQPAFRSPSRPSSRIRRRPFLRSAWPRYWWFF